MMLRATAIVLFLLSIFSGGLAGQTLFFQEDFAQWAGQPAVPAGWTALPANNCLPGGTCYWGAQDAFDPSQMPATIGCDAGGYARAATTQLGLGQAPSLLSPDIDLSACSPGAPLSLHLCLINPSTQAVDGDGVQVAFSGDGGSTWSVQLIDFNAYPVWTELVLPVPPQFRTDAFRLRFDALANFSSGEIGIDALVLQDTTPVCLAQPPLLAAMGDTSICRDNVPDWVHFSLTQPQAASHAFLLTDLAAQLISVLPGDSLDFNELPPAQYRVYGIAYSGTLQATPGLPISTVEGSVCHFLSPNYAQVRVRKVTAQVSAATDYHGAAISTYGAQDGALQAQGVGGHAPYTFAWQTQPPQSGPLATGLGAGTYWVEVTDASGCPGVANFTLTQPDSLWVQVSQPDSSALRCAGDATGVLAATVHGGVAPFTYAWSGTGQQGPVVTGLDARTYSLVVSDANGALAVATYTLAAPPPLIAAVAATPPRCSGGTDGEVTLSVTGGQAPYALVWDHGSQGDRLTGLPAGAYRCTITDAAGCQAEALATLEAAPPLTVTVVTFDPDCADSTSGWLAAEASGGVPPYQYAWAQGDTGAEVFNLPSGDYTLTLQDARGCVVTAAARLEAPVPLRITPQLTPDQGQGDGAIELAVTGGAPPYTVVWDDSLTGLARAGLVAGLYGAAVSDAQGCTVRVTVDLPASETLECLKVHMGFSPNGDGVNDRWVIPCLERFPENELTVYSRWGQEVFFQANYQNDWDGTTAGQALPAGTYYYLLKLNGSTDRRLFKGTLSLIR